MIYRWSAVSAGGQRLEGRRGAEDQAAVRRQLQARGLRPLDVRLDLPSTLRQWVNPAELPAHTLAECFGFFADTAELEIAVGETLRIAHRNASSPRLRTHLGRARRAVERGAGLADALDTAGGIPPFAVQLLRAAEASGAPGAQARAFGALRAHYRTRAEFARKVKQAVIQPAITAVIVLATVAFVLSVLVPRLRPLFRLFEDLPPIARWTFAAADVLSRSWWAVGAVALCALALAWHYRARLLWTVPGVGRLVLATGGYQICEALGLLLGSGFPAARALAVVGRSLSGPLGGPIRTAAVRVGQGVALSAALVGVGLREEVLETIRNAEQIGQVPGALERAATYYRRMSEDGFEALSNSAGLVLTLGAAGLLVLVGLGIFLPLYSGIGALSLGVP